MTVIEGKSGASGLGYSELKDIECEKRYAYIEAYRSKGIPLPTSEDEQEAFRCGVYLHAARAKWFVLEQKTDKETISLCQQAGKEDCIKQGYSMPELTCVEYELRFLNYAKYWAIRLLPQPYAVELFLDYDFNSKPAKNDPLARANYRTTRLDDLSFYPDVGGHCIGEFKSTYDLAGALKYYNENNPQILLQQLIYNKQKTLMLPTLITPGGTRIQQLDTLPPIKGTMVDIWDKGRNRGTRQFIPLNESVLAKFEVFLKYTLSRRKGVIDGSIEPQRNYFVCNTFNDAYKSQCKFKERCAADGI